MWTVWFSCERTCGCDCVPVRACGCDCVPVRACGCDCVPVREHVVVTVFL